MGLNFNSSGRFSFVDHVDRFSSGTDVIGAGAYWNDGEVGQRQCGSGYLVIRWTAIDDSKGVFTGVREKLAPENVVGPMVRRDMKIFVA